MRLETRFVQVPNNPQTINAINDLAAVWGWSVTSIQVTDSKVTYEGNSHGWVSDYGAYIEKEIVTEHTNYASITYPRDMDDPHYRQLVALEAEYDACDQEDDLTDEQWATIFKYEKTQKLLKNTFLGALILSFALSVFAIPLPFLSNALFFFAIGNRIYYFFAPSFKKLKKDAGELRQHLIEYIRARKLEVIQQANSL